MSSRLLHLANTTVGAVHDIFTPLPPPASPSSPPSDPSNPAVSSDNNSLSSSHTSSLSSSSGLADNFPPLRGQFLTRYTRDLTRAAAMSELDPVVGRESELRRVIAVLLRRTKNNPVLVGPPGVGKTAIVEALAILTAREPLSSKSSDLNTLLHDNHIEDTQEIDEDHHHSLSRDVPSLPTVLQGARVLAVDIARLVSGSRLRGAFEERFHGLLRDVEVAERSTRVILFFDEIHQLMGAGAAGDSGADASSLLKPALARGALHCIGATTEEEYRRIVQRDPALDRRLASVIVSEPSQEAAVAMLRGIVGRYESYHGVLVTESGLRAAAALTARHLRHRRLPDAAIDVLDEAASRVRLDAESPPEHVALAHAKATQMQATADAISREQPGSNEAESALAAARQARQVSMELLSSWRQDSLRVRAVLSSLGAGGAGGAVDRSLAGSLSWFNEFEPNPRALSAVVDENAVARVVADWAQIPVGRVANSERSSLVGLESRLVSRVIGQERAVKAVSRAIRRSRLGMKSEDRPVAAFLCMGPSGVGKSELARALAAELALDGTTSGCGGKDKGLIRMDMSEYMERHSVARMIGAPPGYTGWDAGGQLTEAVRKCPSGVVLFDELEKAHSDVFNVLLQILDGGVLTDGKGSKVSFRGNVVICTANIGSNIIADAYRQDPDLDPDSASGKALSKAVQETLRRNFRPELLNRFDDILVFRPLRPDHLERIVDARMEALSPQLDSLGLTLNLTDAAKSWLATRGYNPVAGARLLHRTIQSQVFDGVSMHLLQGKLRAGDKVTVDVGDKNKLVFRMGPSVARL